MSRKLNLALNIFALAIGQIVTSNILDDAAKVFGWEEAYKHLLAKVLMLSQGIFQGAVSYFAQSYNVDGSKPGDAALKLPKKE